MADRRSRGVHLLPRTLEDAGTTLRFLDVVCLLDDPGVVFDHLADDMLDELARTPAQANVACRRVLVRWRDLLEREPSRLLSTDCLIGLFGELHHLLKIAQFSASALDRWIGPHGARHDFGGGGAALEVKTTLQIDGWIAEVHGVDQLEPPPGGELLFALVVVERVQEGGTAVSDLIEALVVAGVDRHDLLAKLLVVGYDSRDAEHYDAVKLHVRDDRVYRVDDHFPRIVRASFVSGGMPAHTRSLRYTIDLSSEPPIPLSENELDGFYLRLAGRM